MLWTPGCQVYALAHFCKSLVWHASGLLFAFFLTEVCDLRPMTMGLVLGGSLIGHALADLAIGGALRHRIGNARAAGRAQWQWAPLTGVFFVLFALTPWVSPPWRIGFAAATLVGFRFTYALVDVPLNAMVALLAATSQAQARLLAVRNMLSGAANLLIAWTGASLLLRHGDAPNGYLAGTIVIAAAMIGSARWLRVTELPESARAGSGSAMRAPGGGSPAIGPMLCVVAMLVFGHTAFRAMEPYAAAFAGGGGAVMIWGAIGSIVSQPLWVGARAPLGERGAALAAGAAAAAGAVLLLGPARGSATGMALAGLCFGVATGGLWLTLWTVAVRAAAAGGGTWSIALLTATSKAAQGAAAICLGWILGRGDYHATFAEPLSPPALLMTGALGLIALCGVALALSRTARGEGSSPPRPAVRPVPDRAVRRRGSSPARERRAARAG